MRIDSSGDLIKIGGVIKGERGTAAAPAYSFSDDTDTGIFNISNTDLGFSVGGTERLRITSAGLVGIGTSSPGANLQIVPTAVDSDALAIRRQDSATANLFRFFQDSSVAEGTGCAHLNTNNRSLAITASSAANANDGIFINATGRVGIGTSSPGRELHISGTGTSGTQLQVQGTSSAGIKFIPGSGDNWEIQTSTVSDFLVYNRTDEATRFIINGSGNVGIGTTSPSSLLTLRQTTASHQIFEISRPNSDSSALLLGNDANSNALISANNADLLFGKEFAGTFTERMRIDSSGRLLVGTSTSRVSRLYYPSGDSALTSTEQIEGTGTGGSLLIVNNQAGTAGSSLVLGKSRGATTGSITAVASGDQLGTIQFNGIDVTTTGDLESCAGSIACEVDGTPGANDMPGRLVFSTTADGTSSPTERMRISSDGSTNHYTNHTNVHIVRSGNAAGTTDSIYVGARSATNTTNGTVVYRVYTNGTYATISDANQKKNVETTRDGYLDDLNKLRVVKYNWNEQEDTDPKELGLIAQEVEQVFPGLVTQIADDTEEQQYKGIKTSVLPFMLLKALQEASAKIEVLEAEVAALKAQ
jgi:hypothetical protein